MSIEQVLGHVGHISQYDGMENDIENVSICLGSRLENKIEESQSSADEIMSV